LYPKGSGNAYGDCWVEFGPVRPGGAGQWDRKYSISETRWDMANVNIGSIDFARDWWSAGETIEVPDEIRGTSQPFFWKAIRRGSGSKKPKINNKSHIRMTVVFSEVDP